LNRSCVDDVVSCRLAVNTRTPRTLSIVSKPSCVCRLPSSLCLWLPIFSQRCKAQNPLHQFPHSKSVTSWRLPRNKSVTSLKHKRQVHNKSVTSWHKYARRFPCVDDDVMVAAYLICRGARWAWRRWNCGQCESDKSLLCRGRFANDTADLLPTCCGLVGDFPVYSEVTGKLV